ncbi:hypothetical protein CsSME_00028955 [Camellia sinensis var. sinensis]
MKKLSNSIGKVPKQTFNNWGLALQELSAIVPVREKQAIMKTEINKYGLAEDTSRTGGSVNVKEVSSNELFSQSEIYIDSISILEFMVGLDCSAFVDGFQYGLF